MRPVKALKDAYTTAWVTIADICTLPRHMHEVTHEINDTTSLIYSTLVDLEEKLPDPSPHSAPTHVQTSSGITMYTRKFGRPDSYTWNVKHPLPEDQVESD